jgi:5-methylcytosine-specific restriction enzyme subunit McrC
MAGMTVVQPARLIELTEYVPRLLPATEMTDDLGDLLWRNYEQQVEVEFPNPKTGHQWRLMSKGWVGHIPLTPDCQLALRPKVQLANLFQMLEYVYNLKSFRFLSGLIDCHSLADYYEQLANILANRVLDRARQGFYRAYLAESDRLPYVRGRLDFRQSLGRPEQIKLQCDYEAHTADIGDNQILAWTLQQIARGDICSDRILPTVRRAYRSLHGLATPTPHGPEACLGRLYHRLNEDYRPLHALCRFFLEQSGPSHHLGDRRILPFLVDMARLYERFVAEWLKANLPAGLDLKVQERVEISPTNTLHFDIDLVLFEVETGIVRSVLDTKYKVPEKPATADISQVTTYALSQGCHDAILIYPIPLKDPLDEMIGNIRVRTKAFTLTDNLEQAGQKLLQELEWV